MENTKSTDNQRAKNRERPNTHSHQPRACVQLTMATWNPKSLSKDEALTEMICHLERLRVTFCLLPEHNFPKSLFLDFRGFLGQKKQGNPGNHPCSRKSRNKRFFLIFAEISSLFWVKSHRFSKNFNFFFGLPKFFKKILNLQKYYSENHAILTEIPPKRPKNVKISKKKKEIQEFQDFADKDATIQCSKSWGQNFDTETYAFRGCKRKSSLGHRQGIPLRGTLYDWLLAPALIILHKCLRTSSSKSCWEIMQGKKQHPMHPSGGQSSSIHSRGAKQHW